MTVRHQACNGRAATTATMRSMTAMLLLFVLMSPSASNALTTDVVNGACTSHNGSFYYAADVEKCVACPANALFVAAAKGCTCKPGFAKTDAAGTCTNCAASLLVPSLTTTFDGFGTCIACGGATESIATGLTNAVFNATTMACQCPPGFAIVEVVGTVQLSAQMCGPCGGGTVTSSGCSVCKSPRILGSSGSCVCETGYTQLADDKACVLTATLSTLFGGALGQNQLTPLNVDNKGGRGSSLTSDVLNLHLASAAYYCSLGNHTSCNMLANLCVLSYYDTSSSACSAYLVLQARESCRGLACEIPSTLPWLYYLRSSSAVLQDANLMIPVTLDQPLAFLVTMYSLNGTWLGNQRLTNHLNLCEAPAYEIERFYRAGTNRHVTCNLNLRWFPSAPEPVFYELFVIDSAGKALNPVPVLVDYTNQDIEPVNIFDSSIQRGAAPSLTPTSNGYRRRFYLYDSVGGVPSGATLPQFVTMARRVTLLLTIASGSSSFFCPLLIIQYQSSVLTTLLAASDRTAISAANLLRTNATAGDGTSAFVLRTITTIDASVLDNGLMIALIVVSCLSFFTAWIRTYGWMRRQQSLMFDSDALGRFLLYLCNHISFTYGVIVVITSWYLFLSYKYQYSIQSVIPQSSAYLFPMLYTAVSCKGVVVVAKIIEQTNADVFVIDWERSKGQLLREEGKTVPISMWRSAFVINELNELQVLRRWRPLLSMLVIVLFLDGLNYINVATNVPRSSVAYDATASTNRILRISICTFFWVIVCLVLHTLEFQIYHRFFKVHPLQAFVDLCSVSNVSVVILLEPQWGFYIHGESIHAHSDVSLQEFQSNLQLEAQGNLPARGLGGQALCQTFEVFLGTYMRHFLFVKYGEMAQEQYRTHYENNNSVGGGGGRVAGVHQRYGHHRHIFEFFLGLPGATRAYSERIVDIKNQISIAFQHMVRGAEKLLLPKWGMHAWLDFPPNVLYMNGPFAGEGTATGGKDLFFFDDPENYGAALLYGLDLDLCFFYMLLFVAIDGSLLNVYASMVITYAVELVIAWYRWYEGEVNLGRKTLMDDRFFV